MTRDVALSPLERAIAAAGGVGALADGIGVSASSPSMWKARGKVPAEHCPAIERFTRIKGQPVLCEELRPDVAWSVLRATAGEPDATPEPAAA